MNVIMVGRENIVGTSLQGYFEKDTSYNALVSIFGQPQYMQKNDKIQVEWTGKINGKVFTIYDYKSDVYPQENTDWHIGGFDSSVATALKEYFAEAISSVTLLD